MGGAVGAALVAAVVQGLSSMEGGDGNLVTALGVGILIGGPIGALFGSFIGEAMHTWEPVYMAEPAHESPPL